MKKLLLILLATLMSLTTMVAQEKGYKIGCKHSIFRLDTHVP